MIYLSDIVAIEKNRLTPVTLNYNENNRVSAITVMETTDVDNWIHGGEILLTNSSTLPVSESSLIRLINALSQLKVAALVIKPDHSTLALSSKVLATIEELRFPVFSISKTTKYLQIMSNVNQLIYDNQNTNRLVELDLNHIIRSSAIEDKDFDFISSTVGLDLYKESVQVIRIAIEQSAALLNKLDILTFLSDQLTQQIRRQTPSTLIINHFILEESDGLTAILFLEKSQNLSDHPNILDFNQLIPTFNQINPSILIGISNIRNARDINITFRESQFTIKMNQIFHHQNTPVYFKDVILWQLINQLDLSNREIPVMDDLNALLDNEELLTTLISFFDHNESISETASSIHAHPNSVRYRLNQIKTNTGLDYRKTSDKFLLYIAVVNRQIGTM